MTRYLTPIMSRPWLAAFAALTVLAAGCGGQEQAAGPKSTLKELKTETLEEGKGPDKAEKNDILMMSYRGTLADGKQFDANVGKDAVPFALILGRGDVIKGWDQGLVGMKVGEKRKLSIPPDLGYGPVGNPPDIPANADLFFEVTLLGLIKSTNEGVYEFEDLKAGSGPQIKVGDTVEVHYTATYTNGKQVDSTRERGSTVTLRVGATSGDRTVVGFDDGIRGMRPGGKRKLWIPPQLMFGPFGSQHVQGNQIVVFDVDVISVNGVRA